MRLLVRRRLIERGPLQLSEHAANLRAQLQKRAVKCVRVELTVSRRLLASRH